MKWTVKFSNKAKKQYDALPDIVKMAVDVLVTEIQIYGPVRGNWSHYSKIRKNIHHCHVKKGKTTYVAVWEAIRNNIRLVEFIYVGTHEKAPYCIRFREKSIR